LTQYLFLADEPSTSIKEKHEKSKRPTAKFDRLAPREEFTTLRHDLKWTKLQDRHP
jgi:hypothetical protein